jgi:uncharacterized protein (TIGR02588 family)
VSAAVVVALIAFLAIRAVGNDGAAPDVVVELAGVSKAPTGWLVEIEATNLGGQPVADVEVEGTLPGPSGEERRSVTLDYLAAGSTRRAGLYFTGDPRARPLTLRTLGFRNP